MVDWTSPCTCRQRSFPARVPRSRPGWVFSRSQIIDAVRGHDYAVTERAVDVHVLGLSRKLGRHAGIIQTCEAWGYRLQELDGVKTAFYPNFRRGPDRNRRCCDCICLRLDFSARQGTGTNPGTAGPSDCRCDRRETLTGLRRHIPPYHRRPRVLDPPGIPVPVLPLRHGDSRDPPAWIDPLTSRILLHASENPNPGFYYDDAHQETYLFSMVDLSAGEDAAFLLVIRSIESARQVVGTFVALAAISGAVAVVVILLVGLTIVRRAHDSQLAVREAAKAYGAGELSFRVHTAGTSAEAALVDEINAMAEALEGRFAGIRDDREDLEAILSSMIEGVIVLNPDRTIRRINGAAARLFDVPAAQSAGQTVLECLRNAQIDEIAATHHGDRRASRARVTLYGEQPPHLQLHATRLAGGAAGRTTGMVVVTSDVTRLQQLENIRRDFVANVSHELRTPITSIKGFVETLQDGVLDDREQSERFLEIILRHTNRLNLIIEDLLTLSRLEQPGSELTLRTHSVRPVIETAVESLPGAGGGKEHHCHGDTNRA